MFTQLPKPAIFAHRGASAYAPENTITSFEMAVRQNSDAIELDAKLSGDGQVVVIHDHTLDRTTDGKGKVSDYPVDALKEFDAGEKYDLSYKGERIPTLDEVFEAVGKVTFTDVELTNYMSPRDLLPEKVAKIVRNHHLEERVIFSSFNPIALRRIHKILPQIPLGLMALPGLRGVLARSFPGRWVPYQALHLEVRNTQKSLVRTCHQRGYRVHTYTVNHTEVMLRLFNMGIDGFFTDDPPLAIRTLNSIFIE